jgi:hypothetical protein
MQGDSIRERESAAVEAAIWRDVAALELEVAHWARLIVLRSQVLIVLQHAIKHALKQQGYAHQPSRTISSAVAVTC